MALFRELGDVATGGDLADPGLDALDAPCGFAALR
jgi:hypothetical protein